MKEAHKPSSTQTCPLTQHWANVETVPLSVLYIVGPEGKKSVLTLEP